MWARAALDIVGDLGGLWIVAVLWRAGRLFELVGATGPKAADIADLQASLDLSFHLTVGVMGAVFACKLAVGIWRLARGAPARLAAAA